jgi:hypothetical protein
LEKLSPVSGSRIGESRMLSKLKDNIVNMISYKILKIFDRLFLILKCQSFVARKLLNPTPSAPVSHASI